LRISIDTRRSTYNNVHPPTRAVDHLPLQAMVAIQSTGHSDARQNPRETLPCGVAQCPWRLPVRRAGRERDPRLSRPIFGADSWSPTATF